MTSPISSSCGEQGGVHRAGAAERDQREVARLDALLDRDRPDRLRHLRVDDVAACPRRAASGSSPSSSREPATAAWPPRRRASSARRGSLRVEAAEHEVRVGHRRLACRRGRSRRARDRRRRSRARRAARRPRRRERAAAGADRVDVDHGISSGKPSSAVSDETSGWPSTTRRRRSSSRPCRRRSGCGRPSSARERDAADRAADRPGEQRLHGSLARRRAVTMPPFDCITCSGTPSPRVVQLALEAREVAAHDRRHVGVEHGRRGALVLAPLARRPGARARRRRRAPRAGSPRRAARARGSRRRTGRRRRPRRCPRPARARRGADGSSSSGSSSSPA